MTMLPKPTNPPKLVKSYGIWLGRVAASLLVLMALIHLFRIDTLVPIMNELLPGGYILAGIITCAVIFSEIFAIPFALRMKLSPLMQVFSGALIVFAPLSWLLISIWAFGTNYQTGQLGEFLPISASAFVVAINLAWVSFSYYTLYTLGYNRLNIRSQLRK